ncbi:TPA: DUF1311 domain-containing protein [Escherichia coli]|nr:DUF1311 domain-containing protein [Escherichia coli]EKJ3308853.1 DUF1311 domain-containing protein [Escherichia coli]EKM4468267.1 DUF1311 domain-containing protein [Escherichia coli]NJB23249.1 DUF1311 domain-containing protein [Escherichia coli]QMD80282.1 DUF1311 domain-containing protein [Escherichia coli]
MKKIPTAFLIITLPVFSATAASFDCQQSRRADEQAICASRSLNDMDVEMSVKYKFLHGLYSMGAAGELKESQTQWLAERRRCGSDKPCLREVYRQRLTTLNHLYDAINKPL